MGLLIINKSEIDSNSYFEMSLLLPVANSNRWGR